MMLWFLYAPAAPWRPQPLGLFSALAPILLDTIANRRSRLLGTLTTGVLALLTLAAGLLNFPSGD